MHAKKAAKHAATFTARARPGGGGPAQLAALRDALSPEADGALKGARIYVASAPRGAVEFRVEADTIASLRAAVNSYLRAAALALEVAEAADNE